MFHAITHVWGREYLDLFLNLCLPNQLAPGNVPALPLGSRYRILTRSIHVEELDAHSMVHRLREQIRPILWSSRRSIATSKRREDTTS